MTLYGYAGKILEVDLAARTHTVRDLDPDLANRFIGGTGLGAYLLYQEGTYAVDPLGPDNTLIFGTGPFAGTSVPLSNRYGVCARSPLTGVFGESECGGHWANDLKRAGYDLLIVRGKADRPVYLWIHDDEVEFRDASHLWGKDTFETHDQLREEVGQVGRSGQEARIICIGPAGERLVRYAAIMNDGADGRAAGSTGMGAVMGSKNLKAIVVRGTKDFPIYDKAGLDKSVKGLAKDIVSTAKGFGKLGTAGGVPTHDKMGNWPVKNWAGDHFPQGAENLSGARMAESILTGRYYCGNCIIGCGRVVHVKEGPYAGIEQAGIEYETMSLNGANLLLDDLAAVQKLNELCNRLGMDTISAGATLGFALEAYERGLIDKDDTDGIDLTWGNGPALVEAMRRAGMREGKFGNLLAEGTRRVAAAIGGVEFAVHVLGLDAPAHDPRAYYANAVAYATSARGACHLSSFGHVFQRVVSLPELGYPEPVNRLDAERTPQLVLDGQNLMGLYDSLKICKFTLFGGVKPRHLHEWYNLITGRNLTLEQLLEIGERIFTVKRMYTLAAAPDEPDTLPRRFLELPRDIGMESRSVPPFEPMLKRYYELRGWTEHGRPKPEVLRRLGLDTLAPLPVATA